MRLLATSDLHFNHPRSRAGAAEFIRQINGLSFDVLLLVGDSSIPDGNTLETCLESFEFRGPRLFVAGNHELWTRGGDSYRVFMEELPRRVRAVGWQWLETEPFRAGSAAIVGTIGWYDYGYAAAYLGIPQRFYEAKISPGAAEGLAQFAHLFEGGEPLSEVARGTVARWNDGRFVTLGRSDAAFLEECLARLEAQLEAARDAETVVVASHHVPFAELMPPPHTPMWDFAKAFLGSPRLGEVIRRFANVRHVLCGHAHMAARARIGEIDAQALGSGYRQKEYRLIEL
jgi:Icc-related predicted phosphoesterase